MSSGGICSSQPSTAQRCPSVYTYIFHWPPSIHGCAVSYTWTQSHRVIYTLSLLDVCIRVRRPKAGSGSECCGERRCCCLQQFHFQGQESVCLLDVKVCPSGNAKTLEFGAFMANITHCTAAYSRSACLSPAESLYLYIPAEFQTLH